MTAGVAFAGGVAEVEKTDENESKIAWFEQRGFGMGEKPEDIDENAAVNLKGSAKPLSEMSNDELDEVGKGKGIVGIGAMKQADKIEAIEAVGPDTED